jgi:NAD(P)-binding Rossmann-like domain
MCQTVLHVFASAVCAASKSALQLYSTCLHHFRSVANRCSQQCSEVCFYVFKFGSYLGSGNMQQQAVKTIAVIGAGASGLVSIKHLRDAGYDVTCFEQDSTIAGTFQNKAQSTSLLSAI